MHRVWLAFIGCVALSACGPAATPAPSGNNPVGSNSENHCGDTPVKGACFGDYMRACPNNSIVVTDCTETTGYTCKVVDGTATCVPQDPPADQPTMSGIGAAGDPCGSVSRDGVCVPGHANLWRFCNDEGVIEEIDCQAYGGSATCQQVDGKPTCK
jgi:hypothetical protein